MWIDRSLNVIQSALATKLMLRLLPFVVELLKYVVPFWAGASPLWSFGSAGRLAIYVNAQELANKAFVAIGIYMFGRMLIRLKDLGDSGVIVPSKSRDVLSGTHLLWKPLVWLIVMKKNPKLQANSMQLLLFDKCLTVTIYLVVATPILQLLNLKLQTVLAVGGVSGLAIGLALQNLVQNLISGILIYINQSVCEGLEVDLQDAKLAGVVSQVGWFNTIINRYDGMRVIVPNRKVLDGTVVDKTNKCFRVCDEQILIVMDDSAKISELLLRVRELLLRDTSVLLADEVQSIQKRNGGNLKIYTPQFVFQGWSPYGAKFRVRAFFKPSLRGDHFLEVQSRLLLSVNEQICLMGGRVGFLGSSGVVPAP